MHDYHDYQLHFQTDFFFYIKTKSRRFQIPSVVKNVLEKPLFRAGLVWTLGPALALKLRFLICPA